MLCIKRVILPWVSENNENCHKIKVNNLNCFEK